MGRAPRQRRWTWRFLPLLVLVGVGPGCSERDAVEVPPAPRAVLVESGKRLARSHSIEDLTALAARGDRVLAALTRSERAALGRGALRFRVDRPVVITVAAPPRAVPFWLADRGFQPRRDEPLGVDGADWPVFERHFSAGWIGLGVNGLDCSPPAHYVVLLRAEEGTEPVPVRGLDPDHWRALPARAGTSAAFGARRPIDRLPAALRGATLLQPAHDQRHATLLARGRIWKTHVPSGREPDQVAIAFGPDAARSLVWTWRTEPGATTTALRLAPAAPDGRGPADPARIRVIRGDSQLVASPDLLNDPVIRRHRVLADDLEPGTPYAYALGDGTTWRTVRTAPERPRRFQLLSMGDPQCGLEQWGKLLRAAHRKFPDAGALLIAGDLVDRGNERTNWDHFFLRASGVFDAVPMMPCVGNHEYLDMGPRLYRATFELPKNGPPEIDPGLVYWFEYAEAFVAVLDSTLAVTDPRLARLQADWLDAALGRTRATWKLVMFHHPVYASHPRRESPALRDLLVPIIDRHRVDLVLQGHDHAYLRTYPLRAGRRVATPQEGTIYVVSVSGTKFSDQDPRDYTAVGLTDVSTYQTLDFETAGRRLTYRAWDIRGREVDHIEIAKRTGSPRPTALDHHGDVAEAEDDGPSQDDPAAPVDLREGGFRSGHGATPRGAVGPTSDGRRGRHARGAGRSCRGGRPAGKP